jgi:hypothetical protein
MGNRRSRFRICAAISNAPVPSSRGDSNIKSRGYGLRSIEGSRDDWTLPGGTASATPTCDQRHLPARGSHRAQAADGEVLRRSGREPEERVRSRILTAVPPFRYGAKAQSNRGCRQIYAHVSEDPGAARLGISSAFTGRGVRTAAPAYVERRRRVGRPGAAPFTQAACFGPC